jgi:uncharacterized membrane protein
MQTLAGILLVSPVVVTIVLLVLMRPITNWMTRRILKGE